MKIAMVTEYLASRDKPRFGGVDSRTINIARNLGSNNDVYVITSRQEGMEQIEEFDGVTLIRTGKQRRMVQGGAYLDRLRFSRQVMDEIAILKPDIVDAIGFVSFPGGFKGAHALGIPNVASVMEIWNGNWIQNMGLIDGLIGHQLERYYLRFPFDAYVCISHATKQDLMEKIGIPEDNIHIVYPGIDLSLYRSIIPREKSASPTLITISRLVRYKKLDMLIHAVRFLKRDYPDIRLKIVGEGPEEPYLRRLAEELGVTGNIDFLGKIDKYQDLIALLKQSDVFVLPSITEGFGMVIIEAMAAGIPYVASAIPTIREVTQEGTGGLLFEPRSVADLTHHIARLLGDPVLRADIVRNNDMVIHQYDWKEVSRGLEHMYQHLCRKEENPAIPLRDISRSFPERTTKAE
jgi:glycosyltransferase involved in cell wall biosynthesis